MRAGGVAQVVECLLSKCEDWNSNPRTTTKRERLNERKNPMVEVETGAGRVMATLERSRKKVSAEE
jgi:hypothetical protein